MINIKQIKSDTAGPVLFQGPANVKRSANFIWNDTLTQVEVTGNIKYTGRLEYDPDFAHTGLVSLSDYKVGAGDDLNLDIATFGSWTYYDPSAFRARFYAFDSAGNSVTVDQTSTGYTIGTTSGLFPGAQYLADHSAHYTIRSIPDVGWVNAAIADSTPTGTANRISYFNNSGVLTSSNIYSDSNVIGIGTLSPDANFHIISDQFDGNELILHLQNSILDELLQIDTQGRIGIKIAPDVAALITIPQDSVILFKNVGNNEPSTITTDVPQGLIIRNTNDAQLQVVSTSSVADLAGAYGHDLRLMSDPLAGDGFGIYLKGYGLYGFRTGLSYINNTSGEPNLLLVPDGFGNVGIGTTSVGAKLDIYGTTGAGEYLLRLNSTDWSTVGERSRLTFSQDELFVRANTYTFRASSDSGNANIYLRGDSAGLTMVSDSLNTATFAIVNGSRPNISAPHSGQIYTDAFWAFGSTGTFLPAATIHIQGPDTSYSTSAFLIQDVNGVDLFRIRDNGAINMGNASSNSLSIGAGALADIVTYVNNTVVGVNASPNNIGQYNTIFGSGAASAAIDASRNVIIGNGAGALINNAFGTVIIGWYAGLGVVDNTYTIAIGMGTLVTPHTGVNIAIGSGPYGGTLGNLSGSGINTAVGNSAGAFMTLVDGNTLFGDATMLRNVLGRFNTVMGGAAGTFAVGSASRNVYIGFQSGYFNNDTGDGNGTVGRDNNVFIGYNSGEASTSANSVFIGYNAGSNETSDNMFRLESVAGTLITGKFDTGELTIPNLAGSGVRFVTVDSTGKLQYGAGATGLAYIPLSGTTAGNALTNYIQIDAPSNTAAIISNTNGFAVGYSTDLTNIFNAAYDYSAAYFDGSQVYLQYHNVNSLNIETITLNDGLIKLKNTNTNSLLYSEININNSDISLVGQSTITNSIGQNSNLVSEQISGAKLTTINATPTTLQTIPTTTNSVMTIHSVINYIKTSGTGSGSAGDGSSFIITTSVKNIGGVLTLDAIQNTYTGFMNGVSGTDVIFAVSGTNIVITVTGVVNDNINWNVITKTYNVQ